MLQLAVTAHVEIANEVVLAGSSLLHGLIRLHSVPVNWEGLEDTDFADVSQRTCRPLYNQAAGCAVHSRSARGRLCCKSHQADSVKLKFETIESGGRFF